jgi:integrase/recombinase XerD
VTTDLAPVTQPGDRLAGLVAAFLAGRKSEHTAKAYRGDLASWLGWCAEQRVDPLDAWPAHVQLWLAALDRTGEAGTTRDRRLGAVSSWYRWLIANQAATRNPAALTRDDRPTRAPRPTPALATEHTTALLARADLDTPRSAAIVWLMLQTGVRVGELIAANTGDRAVDRGHVVLHVRGKGGKGRIVLLVPPVVERLDTYLATRTDSTAVVLVDQAGAGRDRPLIATATGRRIDREAVVRLLRRLARAAGLPPEVADRLTPHTTRATYVTDALDEGVPIYDVAREVGHASTDTTRGYDRSHYDPSRSAAYRLMSRYGRHLDTTELR